MKTEYKRDLKNNYLVIEAESEMNIEEYVLRMTEKNIISGLLPMQVRKMDGSCYLYYEITSCQPLESMYEKKVLGHQDILHILSEVQKVFESVRKYLLNPQQLLFDPRYMYINAENPEILFCYFPALESSLSVSVLAEYILKKLDHKDANAVSLGYSFYQHAAEENFSLSETLHEILETDWKDNKKRKMESTFQNKEMEDPVKASYLSKDDADGKKENRYKAAAEEREEKEYEVFHKSRMHPKGDQKKYQKEYQKEYLKEHQKKDVRWVDRLFQTIHPAILIGTLLAAAGLEGLLYFGWIDLTEAGGLLFLILAVSILLNRFWRKRNDKIDENGCPPDYYSGDQKYSDEDKTEYLSEPGVPISAMVLVSECPERYPPIRLQYRALIVGKSRDQADILLPEAAVSRIHARLEQRKESCYVRDLNSKNGTYLNGVRLKPQEEVEIRDGDSIIFANVRYSASSDTGDPDRTQLL